MVDIVVFSRLHYLRDFWEYSDVQILAPLYSDRSSAEHGWVESGIRRVHWITLLVGYAQLEFPGNVAPVENPPREE